MSRRLHNPNADKAAQNQATIKTLLKLDGNKSCADCKRNKHPRWASWNLGVFVCIRCSGIHRGMGTHISRVKSVDLDAWTDEQLQSVVQWGNARANRYWEAKLAPGHIPSESKIENFIRTKYESKRWVMDGDKPDPSTLDDGTDQVPAAPMLQKGSRLSQAAQSASTSTAPAPPAAGKAQALDLFGDDDIPAQRPSTTGPSTVTRAPEPKAVAASPKQTKPGDSLLGLDFMGAPAPARSASTTSLPVNSGPSRPDLKQSILSLYASAPKPQPQTQHAQQSSVSSTNSPPVTTFSQQSPSLGGLGDAFGGLTFGSSASPAPSQQASKPSAFAGLGTSQMKSPSSNPVSALSGGNFFGMTSKPAAAPAPAPAPQKQRTFSNSSFGAWDSAPSPVTVAPTSAPAPAPPSAALGDMFGFGAPAKAAPQLVKPVQPDVNTAFNLSKPAIPVQSKPLSKSSGPVSDPFLTNDVWDSPDPPIMSTLPSTTRALKSPHIPLSSNFAWASNTTDTNTGFGNSATPASPPKIAPDEDFGGWSSAAPVSPISTAPPPQISPSISKPAPSGGFGGGDDLFGNVWE
ncbi:MAG: hypothetical protein M1814_003166 [Vezdaea aestivalis]|nr:MAG: hypothetical protein M1814_003166 [Vezdaea aestivalis]